MEEESLDRIKDKRMVSHRAISFMVVLSLDYNLKLEDTQMLVWRIASPQLAIWMWSGYIYTIQRFVECSAHA